MKVSLPNMTIDFVDVQSQREAMQHAEILFLENIYNLPRPYVLLRKEEPETYFVRVY